MDYELKLIILSHLFGNVFLTIGYAVDLQLYNSGSNWTNANKKCKSGGLVYDLEIIKFRNEIPNDQDIWIGKALYRLPWIEKLGCIDGSLLPFIPEDTKEGCLGKCRTKYFGYQEQSKFCLCLTSLDISDREIHISNCYEHNNRSFLLYKDFGYPAELLGKGDCVSIFCTLQTNYYTTELLNRPCHGNTNVATKCENSSQETVWNRSYNDSDLKCRSQNKLLVSSTFCENKTHIPEGGQNLWTNVFRATYAKNLTLDEAGNFFLLNCYVARLKTTTQNIRQIYIYQKECNESVKWWVCQKEKETDTTISFQSTKSIITESARDNSSVLQETSDNDDSLLDVGTFVWASIGITGILAVVCIVLLCRNRFNWIFKAKEKEVPEENIFTAIYEVGQQLNENNDLKYGSNSSYDTHDTKLQLDSSDDGEIKLYITTVDGEYDTLNNVEKRKMQTNENTYDSHVGVKNVTDPTYSTAQHCRQHESEDIYDHGFQTENNLDYGCNASNY